MFSIDLPKLQTLNVGLAETYSSCFYFASLQLKSMIMGLVLLLELPSLEYLLIGNVCFGRSENTVLEGEFFCYRDYGRLTVIERN